MGCPAFCHMLPKEMRRRRFAQTGQPLPQNRLSGDAFHMWPQTLHFHHTFLFDRAEQFCGASVFFSSSHSLSRSGRSSATLPSLLERSAQ